jgi:hypothetical protein
MALVVSNSLEIPKPSHWPISMARFGSNPFGEPMYRVVFAPTVKKLVFGQFPDGYVGGRVRPMHREIGNKWIIEKWISAFEDTKMTPSEYERYGPRDPQSGMLIDGPYPYQGTYNHCWTFDGENPEPASIEIAIRLVEKGKGRSFSEIKAANREMDAKQEKQAAEQRFLRVRETEPLYGIRPASFPGGPKAVNHKSQRLPIAANDLGMPTKRGSVMSMRGPKVNIDGSV